ncbi:MAG: hypothetical protein R3B96_12420 [Pirellulaceae bacterium]
MAVASESFGESSVWSSGLVVMFGGRAVLGGDHWYVIWPAMVLVFSIQSGRIAFQKGVSRKEPH